MSADEGTQMNAEKISENLRVKSAGISEKKEGKGFTQMSADEGTQMNAEKISENLRIKSAEISEKKRKGLHADERG